MGERNPEKPRPEPLEAEISAAASLAEKQAASPEEGRDDFKVVWRHLPDDRGALNVQAADALNRIQRTIEQQQARIEELEGKWTNTAEKALGRLQEKNERIEELEAAIRNSLALLNATATGASDFYDVRPYLEAVLPRTDPSDG